MCRWIAYRGETTALEHYVTEPAHSLISQSIHALESTASTNGDGFGLAGTALTRSRVFTARFARPGRTITCDTCAGICSPICSSLMSARDRHAITRPNCHPFACGKWMFMHNGFVGNWSRLRRQVEALIPDELYPSRIGTTDSEAIFLAILGADMEQSGDGGGERFWLTLTDFVNQAKPGIAFVSPPLCPMDAIFMRSATRSTIMPIRSIFGNPSAAS